MYAHALRTVQDILHKIDQPALNAYQDLLQASEGILQLLENRNQAILLLTTLSTASNYLYGHLVNVAILSLYTSQGLRWKREDLLRLGICALLYDVGMIKYLHLVEAPRTLTEAEQREIQLHPIESKNLVDHIKDMEESTRSLLSEIVGYEHERFSGKGYPKGLKSEEIQEGARVVGLCDMYEAMTHYRSWREPLTPHEALKTLLREHSHEFDPKLVKVLLQRLSLFPPGSYVQLSSGEVAMVREIHSEFPTRPTIEIRITADGHRLEPVVLTNLVENPILHIVRAVDETRRNLKDMKLLLQLQANRWWTE